jgi:C-terminal processing protease CtpA/Prc
MQPDLTNDTDHYGFGVRGIPVVHYGVGGARDHYHAVTDEADRIAYDALAARTTHIIALAQLVANSDSRIPFAWKHPRDHGITGTNLTAAELSAIRLDTANGAIKVNAVAYGLSAHAAGIRPGDIIVAIAGTPIPRARSGLRALRDAMLSLEPGGILAVTLVRDGAHHDVTLRFDH